MGFSCIILGMKELPLVETGKSNKEDGFLGLVSFDVFWSLHTIQSVDTWQWLLTYQIIVAWESSSTYRRNGKDDTMLPHPFVFTGLISNGVCLTTGYHQVFLVWPVESSHDARWKARKEAENMNLVQSAVNRQRVLKCNLMVLNLKPSHKLGGLQVSVPSWPHLWMFWRLGYKSRGQAPGTCNR